MNEKRYEERRYFGFTLDQTSVAILFILAITFLIGSISRIYNLILDLIGMLPEPSIGELIFFIINTALFLIPLAIMCYTLFFCLKKRNKQLNNENNGINWFGFEMNRTSATVLFFISLIGLIFFGIGIYGIISLIIFYSNISLDLPFIFIGLIPQILLFIGVIIMALIYVYTMKRCLSILKKTKKEKEISTSENKNKAKFFGFELNETSGSIIFILSLVGVLSYISLIFIYILNFSFTTSLSDLLSNLLFFIIPLIFLGIYIYPLVCCLKLRKIHLNNKTDGIKWFGFEMNNTSACILYVMSILGLIGFLSTMFGFINNVIGILSFIDDVSQLLGYLIYYIGYLIQGIILLLIYIYTIRRCLKVRDMRI